MKLSIYTFVKDGLYYDFHVCAMLRHHLPLADEIVVNEGGSSDGTYDAISRIDPKIKVFRSEWGRPSGFEWFSRFKNEARIRCSGDWCILLDCDEFIPEWDFDRLRGYLEAADGDLLPMKFINFYGNYKVYHRAPRKIGWAECNVRIHRNVPDAMVWGDGANVRVDAEGGGPDCSEETVTCHHFGFVRNPARLRQKWRNLQGPMHLGKRFSVRLPSVLFDWRPHEWEDPAFLGDLAIYDGPYIKAVRDDPEEFVRDGYRLCERVARR